MGYLGLGLVMLIINRMASMAIPYAGKHLMDEVILKGDADKLKYVIVAVGLAILIQSISSFFATHILGIRAQKIIADLRTKFYSHIIQLTLSYFKNNQSGALTSRVLSDFDSIRVVLGSGVVELFSGLLSVVFAFALMLVIHVKLTLLIVAPISIFAVILFGIFKQQKHYFKNRKVVTAEAAANLTESFLGIKLIKGMMNYMDSTQLMGRNFTAIFITAKGAITSKNVLMSLGVLFLGATTVLLMWFGGRMVIQNVITIGDLTSFTMYLALMISPFFQLARMSNQFTDAFASIDRINETINEEREEVNTVAQKTPIEGAISFKNVSFNFGKQQILKNISFTIKPNTVNAIIGKSGSGKTTLTDLITSFYTPISGDILIDNNPLSELNINDYRSQIGFVFQEPHLFNISVKQNILLADPNATDEALNKAMQAANVMEFLPDLPDGGDTVIGENGSKISMGQKQRIAIARAFLSNPKVLILDEVTSNLDPYNEQMITESISRLMKNRTIIIIAHRINTIQNSNQVLLLDSGALIGGGTLKELQQNHKAYFSFLDK